MPEIRKNPMTRTKRRTGRRHPLATVALLALGLVFTGGAYAALSTGTVAQAEVDPNSQQTIEEGKKLFQANCATCHGLEAQGTTNGPTLVGVGAASRRLPGRHRAHAHGDAGPAGAAEAAAVHR